MTKLYAVKRDSKGRKHWCGPTSLAALTGLSYEEALKLLKRVSGRKIVRGTHDWMMRKAFDARGYRYKQVCFSKKLPTLARFLAERDDALKDAALLVEVTGHFLAVHGNRAVNTGNGANNVVYTKDLKGRRARVRSYWIVEKDDGRRIAA
jgi:hypothetical protein